MPRKPKTPATAPSVPAALARRKEEPILRAARALERIAEAFLAPAPPEEREDALAWRWTERGPRPIRRPHLFDPGLLVGVDDALAQLDANTVRHVGGRPANDVLLWGARGTGKSSLVKAMLTRHHARGLRMIAVERDGFESLPEVGDWVSGRAERFILFLDDLSFGEGESSYRTLKSLLDGGLEARPANLLVYATSNRRHLLPEHFWENTEVDEIHPGEAVEERISLADRFGLRIGLYAPDQATYLAAVDRYLDHAGFDGGREAVHREALRFALAAGHRSGRTALQFVRSLDIP